MTVIAITRELGTRGLEIAKRLGERLQLEIVNDDLIEGDIARLAGLSGAAVHRYFEGTASLLERWRIDDKRLSQTTSEEVLDLAVRGNVIIRGWGAPYLLRDIAHVLCVRICAPLAARQAALVEQGLAADETSARRAIERQDAANDKLMRRLFGADGREATSYALVLNSARLGVERCVEQIAAVANASEFRATEASQRALTDQLVHIRVRAALDQRLGGDGRYNRIDIKVADGHVSLSGVCENAQANATAREVVGALDGVRSVSSEIRAAPYAHVRAT